MFIMRTTPNNSEARPVAANSLGGARSREATLGKLASVSTRLNLFAPRKWSMIQKKR
jgi:hypothetical protein